MFLKTKQFFKNIFKKIKNLRAKVPLESGENAALASAPHPAPVF
jgi:hypothetical protein